MLEIEDVNGIIIAPDGSFKSFGIYSDKDISLMSDINFHDSSFKMEVAGSEWFKKLQEGLKFNYTKDTIHSQIMDWANMGILSIVNASSKDIAVYCVFVYKEIFEKQRELLEKNYDNLKRQVINNDAYFETYIFDGTNRYNGPIYGIDSFYDLYGLVKGSGKYI